jgi:hypothetical protein
VALHEIAEGEVGKDLSFIDQRSLLDPSIQIYLQVEFEKERESKEMITDGGRTLQMMLCRQLALAHELVDKSLQRALGETNITETARIINAATRLMNTFQQGMLVLHRVQSANEERITVQQVNVSGGNAIVAASMRAGAAAPTAQVVDEN